MQDTDKLMTIVMPCLENAEQAAGECCDYALLVVEWHSVCGGVILMGTTSLYN